MPRILPIELKEFNAQTLSGTYQNFGTPLLNPAIKISVFNTGDTDAYINFSGTTSSGGVTQDQTLRVPAFGALTLDESTLYFRGVDQEFYFPRGAQLKVKQVTAPSTAVGALIAHCVTRVIA